MFKVSQEIRLNTNLPNAVGTLPNIVGSNNNKNLNVRNSNNNNLGDNENDCIFGRYHKTPDADCYPNAEHQIFVAPELTDVSKVQLLHFPNNAVIYNSDVSFTIKSNGVKGNFEVKVESPSGACSIVPLQILDPERFKVDFSLNELGLYKIHVKCNSVALPKSPLIIVCISGETGVINKKLSLPIFESDGSKVTIRGLGLSHLLLNERNEFTIDASEAGNNILFVGICGPKGQCDEIIIKHLGRNIYKVCYQVEDPGEYLLAAKWGDEHIPGSPFHLSST